MGRAVRGQHHKLVRHLLETSVADINVGNSCGWTPLHYAAREFDCKMMILLLEFGAQHSLGDNKGETPMYEICETGYKDNDYQNGVYCLWLLLEQGAKADTWSNIDGSNPLEMWAATGDAVKMQLLLQYGADWTKTGISTELNRWLSGNAKMGWQGKYALHLCGVNMECVDVLLKFGENINSLDYYRRTIFHTVAMTADEDTDEFYNIVF